MCVCINKGFIKTGKELKNLKLVACFGKMARQLHRFVQAQNLMLTLHHKKSMVFLHKRFHSESFSGIFYARMPPCTALATSHELEMISKYIVANKIKAN